mmetsp:Transcript_44507/g.102878  ORF Transcript_44507/g.102878 Transcript_44507/m.102878 type:complete len:206 (+) Transcript_44507:64-681(+)|eukprot:CAMPEP_0171097386 /NCGR_PEP_ID=MMETSP0766_2-20121228/47514_1 /TAXON_ID=439317 /ORGANISM="Gambierdiscus australes, Strain CAWD 149" /LENGTH=205 /DNA_ID=CAMNT_0011556571 /DNA_START=54 /DNA_END=671 /DNA_ORIENTATION=+
MEFSAPGAKYGMTSGLPTCTKQGVVIFGGHSGLGMLQAAEIARGGLADHVMTVSKRGKPMAPGPSAAFITAMSESTTHYMAACDESDQKAVECLLDWAPPAVPVPVPAAPDLGFEEVIAKMKTDVDTMSPAQLARALEKIQGVKNQILLSVREVKARLQHKTYGKEKEALQEEQLQLQEHEAAAEELLADLTARINRKAPAITGE